MLSAADRGAGRAAVGDTTSPLRSQSTDPPLPLVDALGRIHVLDVATFLTLENDSHAG